MTSVGNRERRILLSLQVSLGPLTHGILTSAVAVFMLSTSPFEFVIRHFFWLLLVVLCVGAFNSLIVFPIILSMIGPEAELVPLKHPDRISTPSPQMSRSTKRANKTVIVHGSSRSSSSRSCGKPHYNHKDININDPSLTTITEEPPSWKSSNSSIQMNHNEWNAAGGNNGMGTTGVGMPPGLGHYGNNINYANNMNTAYHHVQAPSAAATNFNHHSQQQQQPMHHHYNPNMYASYPPPPQYHQQPPPPTTPLNNAVPPMQQAPPPTAHQQQQQQQQQDNKQNMNNFPAELQSIVVQPEVTVETHHSDTNTTKVTATANIKVELVTPGRAVRSYNFTS